MVRVRVPLSVKRAGSGWPCRITAVIWKTARTARTTATRVTRPARTVATICTVPMWWCASSDDVPDALCYPRVIDLRAGAPPEIGSHGGQQSKAHPATWAAGCAVRQIRRTPRYRAADHRAAGSGLPPAGQDAQGGDHAAEADQQVPVPPFHDRVLLLGQVVHD